MENDDDKDNKDTVLEMSSLCRRKSRAIIPSNQLRLIPLYAIITHIYEDIIEKAAECEFTYGFNIEELIHKYYKFNTKLATPGNKTYIINEIKRLFPGIKITEIVEKHSAMCRYNSYWSASWEEEKTERTKAYNIIMGQNNIIMGQKAVERIQKSRQKYKKLYN